MGEGDYFILSVSYSILLTIYKASDIMKRIWHVTKPLKACQKTRGNCLAG